jgi:hypothetical protein
VRLQDVGVLVVRPALLASPQQLTMRESAFFSDMSPNPNNGSGFGVMLLMTNSQPEIGSNKTDFVLIQPSFKGTSTLFQPEPLQSKLLRLFAILLS